jgi:hypothetical protein
MMMNRQSINRHLSIENVLRGEKKIKATHLYGFSFVCTNT